MKSLKDLRLKYIDLWLVRSLKLKEQSETLCNYHVIVGQVIIYAVAQCQF